MRKKIKIAFCSDMLVRDFDGCQRTIFQILDRRPDEVDIIYITGEGHSLEQSDNVIDIPPVRVPFNSSYRMVLPHFRQKRIEQQLDTFRPDVIHIANPSALGQLLQRYACKRGLPVTTIYHTHYPTYVSYYLKHLPFLIGSAQKLIRRHLRNFYNNCELVMVPTSQIKSDLMGYGISSENLVIWERGIDKSVFHHEKQKEDTWLNDLLVNSKYNILFASRLVWEKNVDMLIRLYKEVSARDLPYNFIIAGDGMAKTAMKETMPNATFLGMVSHEKLTSLYRHCDLFVFPSISETYGNVLIEAMACGLPCVVAKGGGPLGFIEDGVNGLLVNAHEVNGYLEAISRIVNDNQLKRSLIDKGLDFSSKLNWDDLVSRFYLMLAELVEERFDQKQAA